MPRGTNNFSPLPIILLTPLLPSGPCLMEGTARRRRKRSANSSNSRMKSLPLIPAMSSHHGALVMGEGKLVDFGGLSKYLEQGKRRAFQLWIKGVDVLSYQIQYQTYRLPSVEGIGYLYS